MFFSPAQVIKERYVSCCDDVKPSLLICSFLNQPAIDDWRSLLEVKMEAVGHLGWAAEEKATALGK